MAAVEKLFGTIEEYNIFYTWCDENIPLALKYFTLRKYVELGHSMCLLPESIDMVLLEFCPLGFITDQIKFQYDIEDARPETEEQS